MNDLQPILEEFGVQAATLEPLTSTENNNHRVSTSTGEQFLLRQHQSESHSLGALESEMIWLNVLGGVPWLEPDMALFVAAMNRAKTGFEDTTTWCLIHADLHPGNVIVQGKKVAAIDFDRCGFGPVMFDVVSALGYLEDDSRKAFLRGYSAVLPLPTGFQERRSLFTIAEWLTNLAFLALRPQDREYVDSVMLPGLREQLPKLLEKL